MTSVHPNHRRRVFEVEFEDRSYDFPYGKCDPSPSKKDPLAKVHIDPELGEEGFTYLLRSGAEGSVLSDHVFDANRDPGYMRDLLLYNLTVEAQRRLARSPISKREVIRRLGTSATQFYRIIDQTNYRKSVDQVLRLLAVLDCEVEFTVKERRAGAG